MLDDPDALFDLVKGSEADEIAQEMARLFVDTGAIKFGKFPLKYGRATPYILDPNLLSQGCHGFDIGRPYAKTIDRVFGPSVTVLYAASPRALPFATLAAWYYGTLANPMCSWACPTSPAGPANSPSVIFGAQPTSNSNVVIIDDVFTSGVAVREAVSRLKILGANILGVCALVDRKEKSKQGRWMTEEIRHDTGVKVVACAAINDVVKHIPEAVLPAERRATILGTLGASAQIVIEPENPRGSTLPD